jgi:hypothetical protein
LDRVEKERSEQGKDDPERSSNRARARWETQLKQDNDLPDTIHRWHKVHSVTQGWRTGVVATTAIERGSEYFCYLESSERGEAGGESGGEGVESSSTLRIRSR